MRKTIEKYIIDSEMGLKVEPLTIETLKEWLKLLDDRTYEEGFADGRAEIRYGLMGKMRDILTDFEDLKEKLNEIEAEADLDGSEDCSL